MRLLAGLAVAVALSSAQVSLVAVLDGREEFGRLGAAACALDFNGDGFADLFVGEPGWNRVCCWLGGAPFDTTPDMVFRGLAGTFFGTTLAAIGDLNRDGIADLAIGASRDNSGGAGAGRVFIHFGSRRPDTVPDLVLTGREAGGRFGWALAGQGDVNQDSGTDLLVGAPGQSRALLYLGGGQLDTIPDLVLRDGNGDYFGGAVALPGDVTGDSCDDLLVGDYRHTGPLLHGGGCFLYHGGEPLNPVLDQYWEGDEQNRQLGVAVCGPGDLNGDGVNDLAFAGSYAAVVDIHWGGSNISTPPDIRLSGRRRFGSTLDGGNVNRDGFADLLVGANGDDLGVPTGPGHAYVFLGGSPMSAVPDTVLVGEAEGDMFGSSVVFCGDVDCDDRMELLVGAPGHDTRGQNSGRCYVYTYDLTGIAEAPGSRTAGVGPLATIVRGVLSLGADSRQHTACRTELLDIAGRKVLALRPGPNDVRHLAPGVYFVRQGTNVTKVVAQR
ncbi:hypothetical protein FJY69_10105 [candidate division WOR-3 bacterium]|nr:hypothetical protein [candidate division WOR-3 bacterium]